MFWIIPFFISLTIAWVVLLIIFFLLAMFVPIFIPIFVLLSLGIALINIIMHMPLLSILFIGALWVLRDQIDTIWHQFFLKKSYSIQKPILSNSAPLILSIFIVHGLFYVLPLPNILKFAILSLISVYMFKNSKHNHKCCN
ncbi:hypothetical protein [Candidatus Cytomitobacter primus]|uniref:Uncharacterized protein n=1 Tax=Candidatus Cytomitobacter primus TaxID=2066024 RepID=A0A5C0UGM2_9PROT|nr:hypothetical protein [Candidatus Cytomitobacter primus]QEK38703.1 hypothetical protein FZC34_02165 [Candidatus Cytomitobacter primus]